MRSLVPWLRTLLALVLGIVAIELVHLAGGFAFPDAYASPGTGPQAPLFLAITILAGTTGTFVAVASARHRPWLHAGIFFAIMLALDVAAALGVFAERGFWFKILMLASLPAQAWLGAWLALVAWPQPGRRTA